MTDASKRRIFLDMDGVLADFVDGISKKHGRPNPWKENPDLATENLEEVWGLKGDDLWKVSDYEMWVGLKETALARRIVEASILLVGQQGVFVLSSPTYHDHGCIPGKIKWLEDHFPVLYRQAIFTKSKYVLARPGDVLLDDFSKHVREFQSAGGTAVMCPAPHNVRRGDMETFDPEVELKAAMEDWGRNSYVTLGSARVWTKFETRSSGCPRWVSDDNAVVQVDVAAMSSTSKPWLHGHRGWMAHPPGSDGELPLSTTRSNTQLNVRRKWKTAEAAMQAVDREFPRLVL